MARTWSLGNTSTSRFLTTQEKHPQDSLRVLLLLLLVDLSPGLYREVVEADDGVDKAVDVLGCGGRPLEAESVQDLCGVVVGGLNPSHVVAAAQVVGHEWS